MAKSKEELDKRIVFTDTTKRQADFRIRLGYDGMTQSEFFRTMISGYLEQDRDLLDYIEKYKREKKRKKRQGKNSLKKNRDLYEKDLNCTLVAVDNHGSMTLRETGDRLGISFVRVKQIQDVALQKLAVKNTKLKDFKESTWYLL